MSSDRRSIPYNVHINTITAFYKRHWSPILLVLEFCLNIAYGLHGPLHPIDYPTYLQQAAIVTRQSDWDYAHLHGKTGPLVYPGGHAWIFIAFERVLGITGDVDWHGYAAAQCVFLVLCMLVTATVHRIYTRFSPAPHVDCLFFLFTLRARNVFANGLFNDCFQVLFSYLGILLLVQRKIPSLVILLFSIGVSIKMNGLLWAPGVLTHYFSTLGWRKTIMASGYGLLWQCIVAIPFIVVNPRAYIAQSFELSRSFAWFNSVSWKFLPPSIFQHTGFSSTLQILHLGFLVVFIRKQYGIYASRRLPSPPSNESAQSKPSSYHIGVLLFTTHFAGIIWSRSLHYSFYIWYFHTLPLLYRAAGLSWPARISLAALIEVAWNMWRPFKGDQLDSCATWYGSLMMFSGHAFLLWNLCRNIEQN